MELFYRKKWLNYFVLTELLSAVIDRRTSRFTVNIIINDTKYKAYLCNTGKLSQLLVKGKKACCLKNSKGIRLLAVKDYDKGALVDTYYQMKSFEKAINVSIIPWLEKCSISRRNPKLGNSVMDYLLICNGNKVYVELKSAILRLNTHIASYPDTVSLRRHVSELIKHVMLGGKAMVIFVAALPYVNSFKPNSEVDPLLASLIKQLLDEGVIVKAINEYFEPKSKCIMLDNYDLKFII